MRFLLWLAACGFVATVAQAQPPAGSAEGLTIDVQPSASQLVAGAGLGVMATIRNVSAVTLYLRETDLALALPLELEGSKGQIFGYPAFFPTEAHDAKKTGAEYFSGRIALQPGDTYSAFWTRSTTSESSFIYIARQISSQLEFLFFSPGPYTLTVTSKYWTDASFPAAGYRTVTKSVTLPVTAPQFVILLGAALGGVIAYVILPRARPRRASPTSRPARYLKKATEVSGAMMLSVIVTILLSRVAGTQFVISVTVNDFWGAIAIGFAANYAGTKLLDRLVPSKPTSDKEKHDSAEQPEPEARER